MRADEDTIGYFTKLASEKLEITKNKLRHLTMALEKYDYTFTRNKSNQRIYFREDLDKIRQLLEQVKNGLTIDDAAQTICNKTDLSQLPANVAHDLVAGRDEVSLASDEIHAMIEEVAASAAKQAADRVIENFGTEFERRIELRDKQLMMRLREASETKRHKKGLVAKLFGY
ncbi:helix-turn-helix domain-containing protein [Sporolactobacillus shoreicorticis]|uniref:Helix-turn-helix domain-containing protein n=1 Tax=Sporolactobacillus shoreicorticis TaxID=1923877 RepID=A0ABW5RZM3_9BACL|nr:helix-turn-helix domain-containing protein [Sporolactobacillus shoreicorticis]MCO7126977.1 helix-turn-helix domain-containing protein [Sporolactobacillus shoreicorticis]